MPGIRKQKQAQADGDAEAQAQEKGLQPASLEDGMPGRGGIDRGVAELRVQLGLQPGDEVHLQRQQAREGEDGLDQQAGAHLRRQFQGGSQLGQHHGQQDQPEASRGCSGREVSPSRRAPRWDGGGVRIPPAYLPGPWAIIIGIMTPEAPCLLVASPSLLDPNFLHAVVLIVEHDEEGALGLDPQPTSAAARWPRSARRVAWLIRAPRRPPPGGAAPWIPSGASSWCRVACRKRRTRWWTSPIS